MVRAGTMRAAASCCSGSEYLPRLRSLTASGKLRLYLPPQYRMGGVWRYHPGPASAEIPRRAEAGRHAHLRGREAISGAYGCPRSDSERLSRLIAVPENVGGNLAAVIVCDAAPVRAPRSDRPRALQAQTTRISRSLRPRTSSAAPSHSPAWVLKLVAGPLSLIGACAWRLATGEGAAARQFLARRNF